MPALIHFRNAKRPDTAFWLIVSIFLFSSPQMGRGAQFVESGFPAIKVYTSSDIDAPLGSSFVSKDIDGRLIFSSEGELNVFDGVAWTKISAAEWRPKADFAVIKEGSDGELYAGGIAFWGKVGYDSQGRYLMEPFNTPAEIETTSLEVFNQIEFNGHDVYYSAANSVVRWNKETGSTLWKFSKVWLTFELHGEVYILSDEEGLMRIGENDEMMKVGGSEFLQQDNSETMRHCKWFDGRVALFNNRMGLILFDGENFELMESDLIVDDDLNSIEDMIIVNENTMALSITRRGIIFIDDQAKVIKRIDEQLDYRLLDSGDLEIGNDGSLWATVSDGLAKILYPNPVTFFDRRMELTLEFPTISRYQGKLLVSSDGELSIGKYDANGYLDSFESIPNLPQSYIRAAQSIGDRLLIATDTGLYLKNEDDSLETIIPDVNIVKLAPLRYRPNTFLIVTSQNILYAEIEGDEFVVVQSFDHPANIGKIADSPNGDIWMEHGFESVGRLKAIGEKQHELIRYGVEDGLSADQWIPLWRYGDEVCFSSRRGALRFDTKTERFVVAEDINQIIPDRIKKLTRPALDSYGNLWIAALDGNLIMRKQPDGSYVEDNATLQLLGSFQVDEIVFDENDIIWFLSKKTLARLDSKLQAVRPSIPLPNVYHVEDTRSNKAIHHFRLGSRHGWPRIRYGQNSLAFKFSTPYYLSGREIYHSYKLEGFTNDWTYPEKTSEAVFTNLPEGEYSMLVQAITDSGHKSGISRLGFSIAPPIYRTLPAYIAYGLSLFSFIYTVIKLRHVKLVARQRDLEKTVVDQTKALREKNVQLQGAIMTERELKKRAETANQVKSEFLAMVSHEIRTPLNCIVGMTDNLLDTPLRPQQNHMLRAIHTSGQSLVAIISDILDYSRIEAGRIELESIPLSPARCVTDVTTMFHTVCKEKGIKLYADIGEKMPKYVKGDPIRIKQILINLVSNAQKFTDKGQIRVEVRHSIDENKRITLFFTVQDSGIGIESSKMSMLFKSFSQIDSSNTRKYGGTGLGLAICKRLAKLMGGDIGVSSILGQGSIFSFSIATTLPSDSEIRNFEGAHSQTESDIPVVYIERPMEIQDKIDEGSEASEPKDVLLVEDNLINRQVTTMMLRRLGYSCDEVTSGKDACRISSEKEYKLILMDIQMPEMDGIECTRKILSRLGDKAPPIVAVTAKSADSDREIARAAGMRGYLTKPIERAKLKEIIEEFTSKNASV